MGEKKVYPLVKKVELNGISDGWDESCFVYVVPATYEDQKALAVINTEKMTQQELLDYQISFTKERFISGKIKAFNGEDFELIDMEPGHIELSLDLANYVYGEIMGLGLDPKEIRKVVQASALQENDSDLTETSLSTS